QGGTRRFRHEDLTAVSRGADPGCPVDVEADVVAVDAHRLAGVDARPHPHLTVVSALDVERGGDGVFRAGEAEEELVSAAVDLLAAVRRQRGPDGLPVARERVRVPLSQL